MKAVAVALVLIAGAAVVLWFGNTLNSWVLGGLIGGLAAILLSIPISLTLFSYLSRRHDEQERMRADVYEEDEFFEDDGYGPPRLRARSTRRTYEIESYALPAPPTLHDYEPGEFQRQRISRQLPAPTSQRLPAPKTTRTTSTSLQRATSQEMIPRRSDPLSRSTSAEDRPSRTTRTTRRLNYPGFPGYEPGSAQSRQRSAALRAARIEAFQQFDEDEEEDLDFSPTQPPRRLRPSQALPARPERGLEASRQTSQQMASQRQVPPNRRDAGSHPSQESNERALPAAGESSASTRRSSTQLRRRRTDFLDQTEGQERTTEYSTRHTYQDGGNIDGDPSEENLKRPLVRRAPYMYDDDPLRKELTRQLEPPPTRRSSRSEPEDIDEEEDEF